MLGYGIDLVHQMDALDYQNWGKEKKKKKKLLLLFLIITVMIVMDLLSIK